MKSSVNICFGKLMILIGLLCLIPIGVVVFYPQDLKYSLSFLYSGSFSVGIGTLLYVRSCKKKGSSKENRPALGKKSALVVVGTWLWAILIGALPFVFSGQLPLIQSLFESTSGWTTTGLSVMDVSQVPHIFLFHRSFMQFCGGLGFVMMMVMVTHDPHDMMLFQSEGHPDQLMPTLKKTARTIFKIFLFLLAAGTLAYCMAGMPLFDSINHAMASLSTGGFSVKAGSIGEYDSWAIELVTVVLMLFGTTNFAVLLLLTKGKFKQVWKVSEVKFMSGLIVASVVVLTVLLRFQMDFSWIESFRKALLDGISAISTTGFSSMSYAKWTSAPICVLLVLMIIGGGMGSTAGGIKIMRVDLFLKAIKAHIRREVEDVPGLSSIEFTRAQGKVRATDALIRQIFCFIGVYILILMAGTFLICVFSNCGVIEALFDFASSLGTVGLSFGMTGPQTIEPVLIVEMIGMVLGRLEIFVVFVALYSLRKQFIKR